MAKKQKERSESEHYKAEVRSLASENKSLRKALARANKEIRKLSNGACDAVDEHDEDGQPERFITIKASHHCPNCKKEIDEPKDLGGRILISCGACKFRKSYAKESEKHEV